MNFEPDWITTPVTAELLRGAAELEHTDDGVLPHRLPAWARAQCADGQLAMADAQPSGVRLALRTRATTIALDAHRTTLAYRDGPRRPDGVYDLVVDGELAAQASASGGDMLLLDVSTGAVETVAGEPGIVRFTGLPAHAKDIELWLPHNELTRLGALRTDAPVEAVAPPARPVWLHHGSSISQGSNAASPTGTWPALAAASGAVELVNLGLSGSALLDPFIARTMRNTPADLISVKLGINLVNSDLMRLRALGPAVHGFLDTIRDGHPDAPLLVISPIYCPIHEDTPGPGAAEFEGDAVRFRATGEPGPGRLTLRVIRDELARVVKQRSDPNLHYLDGLELYGESDSAELPLADALHPDAETHRRIGQRFARWAFGAGGPFATSR